ncbi:hypothetical protein H6F90_03775 [Trichocoleus sp. FACHB-591]|uniref:hypothetical protein n=1 Tax=Trichocoleus sp. FACHB-591 TaxID=2692872 RepID=UPI00168600B4|nr:hypothetical protein [Trichocoleus sp. FACHB-591]MBD2094266.1 hypothetical protein [Trichocoleus sp. FACHB-591]
MSVARSQVISVLSPPLPPEIVTNLLKEYLDIKQNLAFRKFRPGELNGGRFAECVLRLIQHLDNPPYTPFGTSLGNSDGIIRRVENNTALHESVRIFIPRLARILLDVRNRRDVAHVGGDVSPNSPDALLIAHCADWILTEILRLYYNCPIDTARKIAESINETAVPIIADVDGFVRVQNTKLDFRSRALAILYSKNPSKVRDTALVKWTRYSNPSAFRKDILQKLDAEALIHYENGLCSLLPKGIMYVEKNIPMELLA